MLGIIPLWSARTTGDARVAPLMLYTAQYRPYDVPGFGLDTTPPRLAISPQLARLNLLDHSWHARHRPDMLPRVLVERWKYLANMMWGSWRGVLALLAVVGVLTLRGAPLFALAAVPTFRTVRGWHRDEQAGVARFDAFRDAITPGRAVVFVRYAAAHDPNYSFIRNTADPARARVGRARPG